MTNIVEIQQEINKELENPAVMKALVTTTFKGLEISLIKRAMMEGMMRGYTFKDFLEKNIYAIPFKDTYSLITSVDYARKIGMRSGVVGTSAPAYEEKEGKIISCTITVKRKVDEYIGEYSATAYFEEYTTGRNLWTSKPRTMIAKVAEMHALRKACPEQMAKTYIEEEMEEKPVKKVEVIQRSPEELASGKEKLESVKTIDELKSVWSALPFDYKKGLEEIKNNVKAKIQNENK